MTEWNNRLLGDFIELKRGYDLPKRLRKPGKFPLISSSGVSDFHNDGKVAAPGVVTGRYGTIGEVFYTEDDFWPLNTTLYVRDFKDSHPRFVYYFLHSIEFNQYSDKAAVPGINRNDLHTASISVPTDVKEQKAIAHVLGSLDDKIELNRQMNQTLEAMAQALFKSWFVDFDPVIDNALAAGNPIPDELQERAATRQKLKQTPASEQPPLPQDLQALFPSEFEHSEAMGWIPKGWVVSAVGDVLTRLKAGNRYKKADASGKGAVPIYEQGADILLGFHNNAPDFHASSKEPGFIFGDHTCVTKLSVRPFSISENVISLTGKSLNTYWVYYAVRDKQKFEEYRRHWMELIVKSLILPTSQLADAFAGLIKEHHQKIEELDIQNQTLKNLRDTLLPKLISGELRIPDAEKLVAEAGL